MALGHWEGKEEPTVCQALYSASRTDLIAKLKSLSHSSGEAGSECGTDFLDKNWEVDPSHCVVAGSLWEVLGVDKAS